MAPRGNWSRLPREAARLARETARAVGRAALRGAIQAGKWLGWGFVFFLIYDAAFLPVGWLATREPPPSLRIPFVVLMAVLLVAVLLFTATPAGRPSLVERDLPVWMFYLWPTIVATWILYLASPVFATLALLLHENDMAGLTSTDPSTPISRSLLTNFFLWHFLDLIPILEIPERLNVPPPATYSGTWIGLLVLLYQVGVVIPVFFLFRHYRALVKSQREPTAGRQASL